MNAANPQAPAGRRPWRKAYLVVGGALLLGSLLAKLVAPAADGATFLVVCTVFWAIPLVFVGVRWLWRKLTYRVGVRLFLSYLLIGIAPFPLVAVLAAVAGYIAVGQYASVRFGETFDRWQEESCASRGKALAWGLTVVAPSTSGRSSRQAPRRRRVCPVSTCSRAPPAPQRSSLTLRSIRSCETSRSGCGSLRRARRSGPA